MDVHFARIIMGAMLILLSISYSSNAAPSEQWNLTFGEKANDFGYDMQQTSDGGYIFAGRTSLWIHTRNDDRVDMPTSDYNAMIVKIDAYGNTEWMKIFGGTGDDWANFVQQTSDVSYIFAGSTGSFADTTGSYSDLGSNVDAWLVKIDANGTQQWMRTFGGKKYDKANVIQNTLDGGYIFAGSYGYGTGNSEGWLVKVDANGYQQWSSKLGDVEEIRYVEQTSDDGFILTGFSLQYTETRKDKNAFLIKTDANGSLLWRKNFNGDKDDSLNSVNQTSDNGFILAGDTGSSGNGFADAWLIRTDASGNILWKKTFGGNNNDMATSVKQTHDGGFILAGSTDRYGTGKTDAWLVKTDINGSKKWDMTLGGQETDMILAVRQTSEGDYILAGTTYSYGNGSAEAWLIKVSDDSPEFKSDAVSITPAPTATTAPAITITITPYATEPVSIPSFTSSGVNKDKSSVPGFEAASAIFAILVFLIRRNK